MCRCCVCYTLVRMSVCVYMYMVSEGSVYISMYLNKHAGVHLMQEIGKGSTAMVQLVDQVIGVLC